MCLARFTLVPPSGDRDLGLARGATGTGRDKQTNAALDRSQTVFEDTKWLSIRRGGTTRRLILGALCLSLRVAILGNTHRKKEKEKLTNT